MRKNAFRLYIMEVIKLYSKTISVHYNFNERVDFLNGRKIIDFAYDAIISGKCLYMNQKGAFSVYNNLKLNPQNAILMDMFEELLFGNNSSHNRAKDLPKDIISDIKLKLWSIQNIIICNDPDFFKTITQMSEDYTKYEDYYL